MYPILYWNIIMGALGFIIGIIFLFIFIAIIAAVVLFWSVIVNFIRNLLNLPSILPKPQPIGGKCIVATDCEGWGPEKGTVCCDGICTKPGCQKAGLWYCPKDCPQPIGGKCVVATDCEGWGPEKGTVCCDGKCTKPGCQKAGAWYCPKDCGMSGDKCDAKSGTGWPFSGCDISAGLCCDGKCSTKCDTCKTFDEGCGHSSECCSKKCNQLSGVAARLTCPFGYKDHGTTACCKNAWGTENKNDCHKWSCGF